MPSDKRQRQDEGRLLRLEEERVAATRSQRSRQVRTGGMLIVALIAVAALISVLSKDDKEDVATEGPTTTLAEGAVDPAIGTTPCPPADGSGDRVTTFASGPLACIDATKTYTATVVTSKGEFTIELYADRAPKTVNSFVFLARNHYYDGVTFHRIIPGFVVQGGDATGDPPGTGGPGYQFEDELPTAGPPYYEVGSLAMANSGENTNGSQFYVVTGDQGVALDPKYSLFGKVLDGLEVVRAIEATGSSEGTPTEETTITSVTITEG